MEKIKKTLKQKVMIGIIVVILSALLTYVGERTGIKFDTAHQILRALSNIVLTQSSTAAVEEEPTTIDEDLSTEKND